MFVGIYLALILSIFHFISDIFLNFAKKHIQKLMSLTAGILLAILFLEMFPTFAIDTTPLLFILPLLGFTAFHSIRTYHYKHIKTTRGLKERKPYLLAFFMEHFILGFALSLSFKNPVVPVLLFLPFILLTISSSILLNILDKTSKKKNTRIFLGTAPILGAIVGTTTSFSQALYLGSFGYIFGALLYIVSREIIPVEEKKEDARFFFIGLIFTSLLLLLKGII